MRSKEAGAHEQDCALGRLSDNFLGNLVFHVLRGSDCPVLGLPVFAAVATPCLHPFPSLCCWSSAHSVQLPGAPPFPWTGVLSKGEAVGGPPES